MKHHGDGRHHLSHIFKSIVGFFTSYLDPDSFLTSDLLLIQLKEN